ncbi:pseudouridine synthase [Rapidithrix thailandica]|uniref:Pseudouridine synthase n=1 Tax=Rapidithrix thailandica TaxID=413964 RepID=A0AAW9RWG5_9BACT
MGQFNAIIDNNFALVRGDLFNYYIIYKPYGMLTQFMDEQGRPTLKDLGPFPKDVYPVGRLDLDSEGLLILTNDVQLNQRLLHPKHKHQREYWAQVEGAIHQEALNQLKKGLEIKVNKKTYKTLPAQAFAMEEPENLPPRNPPIRYRKTVPTSWLKLQLMEGKNRQVRKMTAKAGFPTLRLIRARIENLSLGNLQPGEVKELPRNAIYKALFKK